MAAVAVEIPDEFDPSPMERSVLRFLTTLIVHCLERRGKIKTDHLLNFYILFLSFYIMLIFFFFISKILSLSMVLLALNA